MACLEGWQTLNPQPVCLMLSIAYQPTEDKYSTHSFIYLTVLFFFHQFQIVYQMWTKVLASLKFMHCALCCDVLEGLEKGEENKLATGPDHFSPPTWYLQSTKEASRGNMEPKIEWGHRRHGPPLHFGKSIQGKPFVCNSAGFYIWYTLMQSHMTSCVFSIT